MGLSHWGESLTLNRYLLWGAGRLSRGAWPPPCRFPINPGGLAAKAMLSVQSRAISRPGTVGGAGSGAAS